MSTRGTRLAGALAALSLLVLTACEPTCKSTCRQLLGCDEDGSTLPTSGVALDECEASCVFQEEQIEDAEDDVQRARLADHKRCVASSTCDEIVAGACYDAELFPFEIGDETSE